MENDDKNPANEPVSNAPPVEVEEGVTPPAELLLTEVAPAPIAPPVEAKKEPPKKHVARFSVSVPSGHVLPLGEVIKTGFNLIVEVGVRWHPDWEGPQVTVNAYRFFHHGDCLCWSGERALAFKPLLPPDVAMLAKYHGRAFVAEGGDEDDMIVRIAMNGFGVTAPTAKQALAEFVLPEQMGR